MEKSAKRDIFWRRRSDRLYPFPSVAGGEAYSWSYYLDRHWQGQGYRTKAGRLAIQSLKTADPAMPIKPSVGADNQKAQALYRKIRFQRLDELDGDDLIFAL